MSVTAARGFRASGVAAGLKSSGAPDVAVVVNDGPGDAAAAVFTANRFPAAPVLWSRQVLADGRVRAVVLNSGGANACTGPDGFADTHRTAEHAAAALDVGAGDVVVCSTGLIGERLPMDRLVEGVDDAIAALSADGGEDAAQAIRTTDTRPKQTAVRDDAGWTVGGMAKGAGMLAPALATMLCVITTDAVADADVLDRVLRAATARTFDRLDSDGCMSTNDTVLLLASGASGLAVSEADLARTVEQVCADLTHQLQADAEGATKDIRIDVTSAASESDALAVARTVARSNLLKCALYGQDPNWGRVLAAVGTTDAVFEAEQVDVTINGVGVCVGGAAAADRSGVDLTGRDVTIEVALHAGDAASYVLTNDLTHAYVSENSDYPT